MPLQYILGNWDFHSIQLKLRPPVFIPRQETEGLVNISVQLLRHVEEPMVLDVGCGSGAISLALLNHFPKLNCVALDQSKYAAELTQENAIELNLSERLRVVQGKVSDEAFPSLPSSQFDLIVSNPPYVLRKDLIDLQQEIIL
ncbi:UNVERIFIED_CONTAM: hypothetical protein GTU68_039385 [Idotea baltica]|nr:hypothetical protein [Idotea baltica]